MSKLFSVNKKLIGIKKDIFYGLLIATSCSRGKRFYCTYPVEFGVTTISKEISPISSLDEISIFITIYQKTILRRLMQYGQIWMESGTRFLVNSFEGYAKVRNLRRDLRVALSIVETHNTYKSVSMKGKVIGVTMNDAD